MQTLKLQFLRELHFIEATTCALQFKLSRGLQFLRELHFIETGGDRYAYRGY